MKKFYCFGKQGFCEAKLCVGCGFADGTGGEMRECEENPYWNRVSAIAEKQREKGLSKYGFGLEDNKSDMAARIRHLEEELIDGLMYCEWIKEKLEGID